MDIVDRGIDEYLDRFSGVDDDVLAEMQAWGRERRFPIIGPQVGRLLDVLTRAIGARRVLELGSGFGYSAWFFAGAVGPEGLVILTEYSERLAGKAKDYLERAGYADRMEIRSGEGFDVIDDIEDGSIDILFNDAEKEDYPRAVDLARRLLRPGGLLVTDNALWYGRVLDPELGDEATGGVVKMTKALREATDFSTSILPVRDGVSISVKL